MVKKKYKKISKLKKNQEETIQIFEKTRKFHSKIDKNMKKISKISPNQKKYPKKENLN